MAKPWYTAYYGTWQQDSLGSSWNQESLGLPPDQIDYTGMNVIVHFGNGNINSNSNFFFSDFADKTSQAYHDLFYGANQSSINYQQMLVANAHKNGVKVCLSLQAVDPTGLNLVASSPANITAFSNFIAGFVKANGYDGVEIDWEGSKSGDAGALIHGLRVALDAALGTHALIVLSPSLGDASFYPASADVDIDQYNIQLYALMWTPNDKNVTWHECAVYPGTSNNGTEGAIDGLTDGSASHIQQWINAGHDPAKIGLGLPTFGYVFNGGATILGPGSAPGNLVPGHNGTWSVTQNKLLAGLVNVGGTLQWDSVRQASFISGTTGSATYGLGVKGPFFCTLATPQWLKAVVAYQTSKTFNGKQLGGFMLYSLTEDFDPSKPLGAGRNIIHEALRDALGGVIPPPPPPGGPTGTFTATPSSLPAGGGSVTLAWTSQNATAATLNGSGVVVNGSQVVTLTASASYSLVLTGPGGNLTLTASVTVATTPPPPPPSPPTGTLTASSTSLPSGGGSVTLTWTSQNATTATLQNASVSITGSKSFTITQTTQFVLTLIGTGGEVNYNVTVTVQTAPPPTGISYNYVNGQQFPQAAVILPKGSIVVARSFNTSSKIVTVYYFNPTVPQ